MRRTLSLIVFLAACGPRLEPDAMGADGTTTTDDAPPSTTVESTTTTDPSTTTVDHTSTSISTGIESIGFIPPSDANTSILECSIWSEDCPPGLDHVGVCPVPT